MHESTIELSRRFSRGDAAAFEVLFRRHWGDAFAVALRVLGSPAESEDVTQESFFEAWRNAATFNPRVGCFGAWLATITHSRAIDRWRRSRSQARLATGALDGPGEAPGVDDAYAARVMARALHRSMAELPGVQREALRLAYGEGLSHREIAEHTQTALGTVKTRIRAATQRLTVMLGRADLPSAGRGGGAERAS